MNSRRFVSSAAIVTTLVIGVAACTDTSTTASDEERRSPATAGTTTPARSVAPTVRGVLETSGESAPNDFRLVDVSDAYYDGMTLHLTDEVTVADVGGQPMDHVDLVVGSTVDVWVTGACRESFPVQCDVDEVQVVSP